MSKIEITNEDNMELMAKFNNEDIERLRNKGLKIVDSSEKTKETCKVKIEKVSVEKNTIEFVLISLAKEGVIIGFDKELRFDKYRRFRFDWAIPSKMIAIEYEGVISNKSRHTTIKGFSKDCTKYNLATKKGWKVLRYTALNFNELHDDLIFLLKKDVK